MKYFYVQLSVVFSMFLAYKAPQINHLSPFCITKFFYDMEETREDATRLHDCNTVLGMTFEVTKTYLQR